MPRNKSHEVKVGVFVAAGLAIFALFIVSLTGLGFSTSEDEYRVRFTDVAGLENGSIVALGGLKVGRVESVGISPDDPGMMEAVIQVKHGSPIRKDSKISVTAVGVTGSMFLSISLGTKDSPLLKPGTVIRGEEAASFQAVINEAKDAAGKVNSVLGSLGETVDAVSADVKGLVSDVRGHANKVLTTSDRVLRRIESVLSERNERNVNHFLASLARMADRLDQNVGPAVREFNLTLQRTRGSLAEVDRTAKAYQALAGNASGFVTELKGRLGRVDALLARMDRLGAGMEEAVAGGKDAIQAELRELRKGVSTEVASTGQTLRQEIRSTGGQARTTIQEGGKNLSAALGAIEGVSRQVEQFFEANQGDLKSVIQNFNQVSKRVDGILAELSGGPGQKNLQGAAAELRASLERARSLMTQLDEMVAAHREDIHILITDLRETASNLSDFTTTLRERPSTVIFKPPARPREFNE